MARRREEYVGEWLPEPLLTSPDVSVMRNPHKLARLDEEATLSR